MPFLYVTKDTKTQWSDGIRCHSHLVVKSGLQLIFWVLTHCPSNTTLFSPSPCVLLFRRGTWNHVIAVLPTGSSKQSEYEIIEEQNCLYLGSTLSTVTLLLYHQFFTPKHTSLKVTYAWRDPETFLVSFHRNSFWKQKIWLNFGCGCLVLKGLLVSALYRGLGCMLLSPNCCSYLSHLRFFRIKLLGVQSEMWNSFSLLSNAETHTNIPSVLSYFAEQIGWNSFIEFYIVPQLKKCLSS